MTVHNHGPEEGVGLACNESRLPDGSLRGACMSKKLPTPDIPERKHCAKEGCERFFVPTPQKKIQAWRDGWFLQKWDGPAWCPYDIPDWVPSSHPRKTKNGE